MIFAFSTQVTIGQSQNEVEKKFNLIYESLKDVHKGYVTAYPQEFPFFLPTGISFFGLFKFH